MTYSRLRHKTIVAAIALAENRERQMTDGKTEYCCERFAHEAKHIQAFAGGGLAYAGLVRPPTK